MAIQDKIKELIDKRNLAKLGGGEKRIEKQHSQGKMTARERIETLFDEGSFEEFDMFVTHRCTNFGLEKEQYMGDGVGYWFMEQSTVVLYMFILRTLP